jgi:hypothetical protein
MTEKKPLTHPDYKIEGMNAYNFSKWKRENVPAPPARFKVGDKVVFTVETQVVKVYQDCDGTPLYALESVGNGWTEEGLTLIPDLDDQE